MKILVYDQFQKNLDVNQWNQNYDKAQNRLVVTNMLIAKAIKARKHKDLDLQVKYIHLETCTRDFFQLRHVLPIRLKL